MKIGEKIPDLQAKAYHQDKEDLVIKLSDYKGKWLVMLFYPADFTFVCPTELKEAAENYSKFKELGAEVVSVSTDTVFVHKAWHDESEAIKKVQFPMLAILPEIFAEYLGRILKRKGYRFAEHLSLILTACSKLWTFTTTVSDGAPRKFCANLPRQNMSAITAVRKSAPQAGSRERALLSRD